MLSMMRAPWQKVTSDLRSVAVRWVRSAESGSIATRFLHEVGVQ